jgi:hypothetical protein
MRIAMRQHPDRSPARNMVIRDLPGKTVFQSAFMSTTVQPLAAASSSALSSLPIRDARS